MHIIKLTHVCVITFLQCCTNAHIWRSERRERCKWNLRNSPSKTGIQKTRNEEQSKSMVPKAEHTKRQINRQIHPFLTDMHMNDMFHSTTSSSGEKLFCSLYLSPSNWPRKSQSLQWYIGSSVWTVPTGPAQDVLLPEVKHRLDPLTSPDWCEKTFLQTLLILSASFPAPEGKSLVWREREGRKSHETHTALLQHLASTCSPLCLVSTQINAST